MNSRQRTVAALRRQPYDRIPVDFWATKGAQRKIENALGLSYEEFLNKWDVDLRYIDGPEYIGPPLSTGGGASVDIWGVKRNAVNIETEGGGAERYSEVAQAPLAAAESVEDIEGYDHWPSPDWFRYDVVEAQCDRLIEAGRAVVFMGDRLNRVAQLKPAMYIRGTEEIFVDLAIRPEIARAVFGRIKAFYREYLSRILAAAKGKIDIILTGDDFGAQNAPLLSLSMWDAFLREGFADYVRIIHQSGATAMHHTCGSVVDMIPGMIDSGLDILQSLQPEAAGMDAAKLKRLFGERLSFQGGVSIQKTLPFGTTDDVTREVARLAATFGKSGGYIFGTAHNIQTDVSVANVLALLEAYREFGAF